MSDVLAAYKALRRIPGLRRTDRVLGAAIVRSGAIPTSTAVGIKPAAYTESLARLRRALEIEQ